MVANIYESLEMSPFIFVYGTLQQNQGNYGWLSKTDEDVSFVGKAVTEDRYCLYNCGFPYMVENEYVAPVRGELFEVKDPEVLARTDTLEGVENGHYYRKMIKIKSGGKTYLAWAYFSGRDANITGLPKCSMYTGEFSWA